MVFHISKLGTVAAMCVFGLSACSQGEGKPQPVSAPTDGSTDASALPQGGDPYPLDPDDFSLAIDNSYLPLVPGSRMTYRESDGEGAVYDVVVTVTSASKELANGVVARVVRDTVSESGEVIEDTFDWFAQDSSGNVWYLGEDTAEFENGRVSSREGAFEAGVDGAEAGLAMPAVPVVGMAYRQEFYAGHAEDNGEVLSLSEMAEVPVGHYDDVLLTKDTSGIQPDVLEYKFYAPGIGNVMTLDASGGSGREVLIDVSTVSAEVAKAAGIVALGKSYD